MAQPPLEGREAFVHRENFLDQSVEIWNSDKKLADKEFFGVETHLWCYKNKIYDLSKFIKIHPGGTHWIELTRGSDITDFVETHHFEIDKIEEILKKYYVKDSEKKHNFLRYDWSEKGLYQNLKKRIFKQLKGRSPSATFFTKLQYFILIGLFFSSFYCLYLTQSKVTAMVTGFLCLSMLGIGHTYIHKKTSYFRYCADVTLFGSYQWTISHALSHHTYPNLEIDIEIQSVEPFIYYLSNKPKNPIINIVVGHILFTFLGVLNYIRRFLFSFVGKDKFQPENIIPLIELLILWSNAQSFYSALQLFIIMHSIASLHLLLGTFPNHRTDHHWSEGDPKPSKDFAEHTIITTSDHSVKLPLMLAYILFGGFNDHILHHLFPILERSLLPEFKEILIEECKKVGIVYKECNFFRNFWGVYLAFFREKPYYIKKNK